jgi:phospholipid/cholesterol/gamma-HCH transport system substrate-binding protein
MRARAIREGSVGLLILIGVGLFGGLVLWLRGLNPGSRNYEMVVTFKDTAGMQIGTAVRYRGVPVGRVIGIDPNSNDVEVLIEITQADLRIPEENVRIAANQSGFIGETTIDITPSTELTEDQQAVSPTAPDCEDGVIICDRDRLTGVTGVSYESLLRSAEALANTLADPALIGDLKKTLNNAVALTQEATALSNELTQLANSAQAEVKPISDSVQRATNNAAEAAQAIQLTATDVQSLIKANEFNLVSTLDNITRGSERLTVIVDTLASEVEDPQLMDDLRTLSTNAAAASVNIRAASADVQQLTGTLSDNGNILLIQQTLESARDVFQGAQKVLSDVDELTGDPAVRHNLRDLINGLSDLVSSAEVLEQQTQLATALAPLSQMTTPMTVPIPESSTSDRADYHVLQQQLAALAAAQAAQESAPTPP